MRTTRPLDHATIRRCIQALKKPVKLAPAKHRNQMLEMAAGDMAEAYEIGVEETQGLFIERLACLIKKEPE